MNNSICRVLSRKTWIYSSGMDLVLLALVFLLFLLAGLFFLPLAWFYVALFLFLPCGCCCTLTILRTSCLVPWTWLCTVAASPFHALPCPGYVCLLPRCLLAVLGFPGVSCFNFARSTFPVRPISLALAWSHSGVSITELEVLHAN